MVENKKGVFPFLTRVLDKITGLFEGVSCLILIAITLITFMDVVLRKTVGAPTKWGYSLTIVGLMWLVLFDLPLNVKNSVECLRVLARELPGTLVSIMGQYTPVDGLEAFPELQRPITPREYARVCDAAEELGVEGFEQELSSTGERYVPSWDI